MRDFIAYRVDWGEIVVVRERPAYMSEDAYLRRVRLVRGLIERDIACRRLHFVPPRLTPLEGATVAWLLSIRQVHAPRFERVG